MSIWIRVIACGPDLLLAELATAACNGEGYNDAITALQIGRPQAQLLPPNP